MSLKAPPQKDTEKSEFSDGLPAKETSQTVSMTSLGWLFVAPPGFGKTEFFSSFPDALMLSCEAGHKFVTCPKFIIDEWEGKESGEDQDGNIHLSFLEAINRLEKSERFQFVFIDTLDALVKKCIDHHVGKANQPHLSDLGDYGKGFDLGQNDPIRRAVNRIFATGRGIGFTTHQFINNSTFKGGVKSKKETSLPNGIFKIVYPQVDLIIHGEFGATRKPNRHKDRIIRSEGDEDILAKNRGGVLPPAWISPYKIEDRGKQIQSFFDEDPKKRQAAIDKAFTEFNEIYEE